MRWVMYDGFFGFFWVVFFQILRDGLKYIDLSLQTPQHNRALTTKQATNTDIDLLIWLGLEHSEHTGPCFIFRLVYCLPLFVLLQRDIHTMSRGTTLFSRGTVGEFIAIHKSLFESFDQWNHQGQRPPV